MFLSVGDNIIGGCVLTDLECFCRQTNVGIRHQQQQHASVNNTELQVTLFENGFFYVELNWVRVHAR